MNLDFMSLKTMSLASVKGEREKDKILERQKAQEIEQVGGINSTFFYVLHIELVLIPKCQYTFKLFN